MPEAVNANTLLNLQLDKGQILVPTLGPLTVNSTGIACMGELATEADIEQCLKQRLISLPYINNNFVGGMVTMNQITSIELSEKLKKKGDPVVLKGDVKCSLITIPALDPSSGTPDPSPPTEVTLTLSPTQTKFKTA